MTAGRIMVMRSDRLGDLVLCSGYLAGLAEYFGGERIDLWVAPETAPVGKILHPALNLRTLPFTRHLECSDDRLRAWLEEISAENYRQLIIPQFTLGSPEMVALAYLPISNRYGFQNAQTTMLPEWVFLRLGTPAVTVEDWIGNGPEVDPYLSEVSKYAALAATQAPGGFPVDPRLFVEPCGGVPAGVLLWPGNGDEARRWPVERFAEVVIAMGMSPVVIGAVEGERALAVELRELLLRRGTAPDLRICDTHDLRSTAKWIRSFDIVLANDTGIVHLAAALGCHAVSISPAQYRGRFQARGKNALTIFADVPCARCDGLCAFDAPLWPCIDEIQPSSVVEAIQAFPAGENTAILPAPSFADLRGIMSSVHAGRRNRQRRLDLDGIAESLKAEELRRLIHEAEAQRDQVRKLLAEAEAQREQFRTAVAGAEAARERLRALLTEAEAHRDQFRTLLAEAEAQRDQFQTALTGAETERNDLQTALEEATSAGNRWQTEAERAVDKINEYYQFFPWCRNRSLQSLAEHLPKISIVTPSFQQADFIDETIRSVLEQEYPNFEHIVVDGGSCDGTVDILKRYPHLRWVSERDRGQTHAINKGLLMARGDILAYLNSDDLYRPGAFHAVAQYFRDHPEARVLVGHCECIDESSKQTGRLAARCGTLTDLIRYWNWGATFCIPQPSVFYRRELLAEVGLFDAALHMALDYEMWLRMTLHADFHLCDRTLAAFRMAANTKTVKRTHEMFLEELQVSRRYWRYLPMPARVWAASKAWRHTGNRLLNSAEHLAFSSETLGLARELLPQSATKWPALAVTPRFILTGLQVHTSGSDALLEKVRKLHRMYLGLRWRVVQRWEETQG